MEMCARMLAPRRQRIYLMGATPRHAQRFGQRLLPIQDITQLRREDLDKDPRTRCLSDRFGDGQSRGTAGPFPYMKGPIYFLSLDVVRRVVQELEHLVARALGTSDKREYSGRLRVTAIWEDVWMGFALSQLDPPPKLDIVTIDWSLYFENWGFAIRDASIVWHAKTKDAGRPVLIQRYMERHHCMRPRAEPLVRSCSRVGLSCTGGLWRICGESNQATKTNCPDTQRDLKSMVRMRKLNATYSA